MKFLNSLWVGLTRNADGTFSSTKFWQGIGYIVASCVVVNMSLTGGVPADIFLIYVGSITAARAFQNFLAAKSPSTQPVVPADAVPATESETDRP